MHSLSSEESTLTDIVGWTATSNQSLNPGAWVQPLTVGSPGYCAPRVGASVGAGACAPSRASPAVTAGIIERAPARRPGQTSKSRSGERSLAR